MGEYYIRKFIDEELSRFVFKKYTKGYRYLIDTIYFAIIEEDAIENMTKNIFPKVANKYKEISALHVKWCINQVIKTMYNNTSMKAISDYFHTELGEKPSLKFIVYTVVCRYNYEQKELEK